MSGSNTDNSDITMNRTRKQAWRNEQQASTNTNEAIENLKTYFDSKFNDIQQQFSKENEKLAKIMKTDSKYKFCYKSNQIQFDFNESISDKVDTIVKLIKNGSQKRASKLAKSIKENIEKRNKLLKIANKSIAGWGAVEEYISDDLASDSEDGGKIKAAERRALQKQNIRHTNQRSSATTTKPPHHPNQQIISFGMSNKETLFMEKTPAVLPHPPPKMIAGEYQRDHQEEQDERVLLVEEMATGDNLVHPREIIPDNEAETYEDKYFHSSHISSLNELPGNCIKDSEFESGEKVCIVEGSLKNHLQFWHKIGANVCHRCTRKW